jgi:2-C-methyl-D-erythritol 4-phosphate cytidylyltransferase
LSQAIRTAAILVAGGLGERLKTESALPKQYLLLQGRPVYVWSLKTLIEHPDISQVVLVARSEMRQIIQDEIASWIHSDTPIMLAEAGATRQASVYAGLEVLCAQSNRPTHVLVHDAARPFLEREQIDRFLSVLHEEGACAVAMKVSDTIKRTDGDVITETLSRPGLYAMQTPQGASFDLFLEAHRQAKAEGFDATDDVALLERRQISVKIVEGSARNMKITNREDMLIAEALASRKLS